MSIPQFEIAGRRIGGRERPYIIAEVGINHGGDREMARRMIIEAARTGADAVKLQTFDSTKFLSRDCGYFDILKSAELASDAIAELMALATDNGITLFSAVFDQGSADLLNRLGAPAYKIASGDLTHLPLLRHVAHFGKPVILSTGGATMAEVAEAVAAIRDTAPATPLAVLHCVSNYPTAPSQANLACQATMRRALGCPVGYSDHTLGNAVPLAAIALGAEIIEKHFTLDRSLPGPDHQLSSDPQGFRELVEGAAAIWQAIGSAEKAPVEEPGQIAGIRRSVTSHVAIAAGSVIEASMIEVKRPGTGIAPKDLERVIGARAKRDIPVDQTLNWKDIETIA